MQPELAQRGFTLIEVVVAIAIVALGMMAVFRVVNDTANNSAYLRDRTMATWIADNRLTEIRLGTELPSVDETEGEIEFASQRWRWKATVSQTQVAELRRIDVRVRREGDPEDTAMAEVSGFAGVVAMGTAPSGTPWAGSPGGGGGGQDEDEDGADRNRQPSRPRPDRQPESGTEDQE
jgi:general secretion pathway protein I